MNRMVLAAAMSVMLGLSACASMDGMESSSAAVGGSLQEQSQQAISQAEQAYDSIHKRGGAWAYTGETLDAAKEAAKGNDFDKAIKLANEALEQAQMASKQFEGQTEAGPYLF